VKRGAVLIRPALHVCATFADDLFAFRPRVLRGGTGDMARRYPSWGGFALRDLARDILTPCNMGIVADKSHFIGMQSALPSSKHD
jgi:hypothetical protein